MSSRRPEHGRAKLFRGMPGGIAAISSEIATITLTGCPITRTPIGGCQETNGFWTIGEWNRCHRLARVTSVWHNGP
jgi:hypothetical protein